MPCSGNDENIHGRYVFNLFTIPCILRPKVWEGHEGTTDCWIPTAVLAGGVEIIVTRSCGMEDFDSHRPTAPKPLAPPKIPGAIG